MEKFRENKVKIVVKSSNCGMYKPGDEIYIDGVQIDTSRSANVCLTAINSFYPFIYALRKHVTAEQMGFEELTFQCPDCPKTVEFTLIPYQDEKE